MTDEENFTETEEKNNFTETTDEGSSPEIVEEPSFTASTPEGPSTVTKGLRFLLPLAFILVVAFGLYSSAFDNEFAHRDDNQYVTDNTLVRDLSPSGILRIFNPREIIEGTGDTLTEYLPVTTLTHAIIYHYRGLDARTYHSVVVYLFLLDIILLCVLLNLVLENWIVAALACLVFAVHPVHVESVAWVAATKGPLSLAFMLISFILYIVYTRTETRRRYWYWVSFTFFLTAMLSSALVSPLPLLLMLYDFCFGKKRFDILDKLPYFAVAIALTALYVKANMDAAGTTYLLTNADPSSKALMTLKINAEYLRMLFVPIKQSAYYPYWPGDIPATLKTPVMIISLIAVAVTVIAGIIGFFTRTRILAFGIFWFFIAFIPMSNLIPSLTLRADRYLFIPLIGFSIVVAFTAVRLYAVGARTKKAVPIIFAIVVIAFSVLTYRRNLVWQNGITLWTDAVAKYPKSDMLHATLGNEYGNKEMKAEAIREYEAALLLNHGLTEACNNLGGLYAVTGRYAESIATLKKCLALEPDSKKIQMNLAAAYTAAGMDIGAVAGTTSGPIPRELGQSGLETGTIAGTTAGNKEVRTNLEIGAATGTTAAPIFRKPVQSGLDTGRVAGTTAGNEEVRTNLEIGATAGTTAAPILRGPVQGGLDTSTVAGTTAGNVQIRTNIEIGATAGTTGYKGR